MSQLAPLGWTPALDTAAESHRAQGFDIARVTQEHRGGYTIRTDRYEVSAEVSGRLMFDAESRIDYPAVGDWVAVTTYDNDTHAIIHAMLPRTTVLQRKAPGKKLENQLIATNIDAVFVVQSLDETFNLRRIERFVTVARDSGARVIILLSKKDLCAPDDLETHRQEAAGVSADVPVIAYSAFDATEVAAVAALIKPAMTFCLIGASGVGKSTLINALSGKELLVTGEVREFDAKGRHTTSSRELIILETGGILIDTPGMRELGLMEESAAVEDTFDDILEIARECKYGDCTHTHEPDCAVKQAMEDGRIESGRYESFVRLLRERKYRMTRQTNTGMMKRQLENKKRQKELKKAMKKKGKK